MEGGAEQCVPHARSMNVFLENLTKIMTERLAVSSVEDGQNTGQGVREEKNWKLLET